MIASVDSDYTGTIRDGAGVRKAYFAQDTENTLNPENTVLEEAESLADTKDIPDIRNLLGAFLFSDDDVFKKVSVLSGGEKSRLALLKILLHPSNLLLLDEPTNHLDINAKEMLEKAIASYGGTVIFVSHDRHFIRSLATRILYLSEEGPEFFDGDYSYFEYKLAEKEKKLAEESHRKTSKDEKKDNSPAVSREEANQRRNRLKSLERTAEKLLSKLDELNGKLDRVNNDIALPENYSDAAKITKLMKAKEELEKEIAEKENEWLAASEEAEKCRE